jgi:hypothetical protein
MKKLFCIALIFSIQISLYAQRALPVQVSSYISKIPALENCAASFKTCTIDSNNNGLVSVKDAGPTINGIQDDMNKYMQEAMNSSITNSKNNTSMPSQDQMAQMMQNASQMKSMSPDQIKQMSQGNQHQSAPSANTASLMKEVGTGQNAASQLSLLTNEFSTKAIKLAAEHEQKMKAIGDLKNSCPDYKVKGADLALPKCDCIKQVYSNYYQKRITVEDEYLQKVNELIQSYLPKVKAQMAAVDKVESDTNYGDAIPVPALKNQLSGIQRQALSSLTPILGMVGQRLVESAKEYANVVNTNNGHASTPCQ